MTPDPVGRGSTTGVLDALADSDALAILAVSTVEPRSVLELAERCGIPTSTTYRKVDDLVDAGLLDERTRIGPDGRHVGEYVLGTESIVVSLVGREKLELDRSIDVRERGRRGPGDGATAQVETDGGEESADLKQRRLQTLFVDVTGTEEVVDEQEEADSSRPVDGSATAVSEYVTTVISEDGLSDTIDDPDASDGTD